MSGTLKADASVENLTRDSASGSGTWRVMQGKTSTNVPELQAGESGRWPS